jgi:transcriptional regulator with XRE-family HTH domain
MDDPKKILASNLTRLIKEKGIDQLEVAHRMGVAPATVSYWARGEKYPRSDKLPRLADLFNVSLTELTLPERKQNDAYLHLSEEERRLIDLWRQVPHEKMAEVRLRIESSLNLQKN